MVSILPCEPTATVPVNSSLFDKREIICGVPQQSILGPLLFLIYINDLPNCLKKTTPCLYADDTQIFATSNDSVKLANDLKLGLRECHGLAKRQSHPY